jgi:hypothetical protein
MALLPYSLRPRIILRRQIIQRGLFGGNEFLRPIAMMLMGHSSHLRRIAIREGVILGRPLWRLVGIGLIGQELHRVMIKKSPDRLAVERIGPGNRVHVRAIEPTRGLGRRERRAELRRLEAEAVASVEARLRS